jgi:hypothetical protein
MGSLDWKVSALGFGCMRLPTIKEIDKDTGNEKLRIDREKAIDMIRYGIDNGINYIDTAWPYHDGESEIILGEALKDGYREKVKLVTKLPIWEVKEPTDFDEYLEKQLDKLQTDYLDVYLIHSMNQKFFKIVKEINIISKMEHARENGLINHIGFSFHDKFEVFKEIIDYYDWDVAQIQYNYLDINYQATTKGLKYASNKGIAMVIMEPLQGGKLTREFSDVQKILEDYNFENSLADIAFQFLWDKPEVSVVLSGMSEKWMVEENIQSAEKSQINSLNKKEKELISKLRDKFKAHNIIACTACSYCMPCPNSVNIPRIMTFLNDFAWWGESEREKFLRYYNKFLLDPEQMEESEKKENGNASLCTECEECLQKCPQGIDIPEMMKKANLIFEKGKSVSEILN